MSTKATTSQRTGNQIQTASTLFFPLLLNLLRHQRELHHCEVSLCELDEELPLLEQSFADLWRSYDLLDMAAGNHKSEIERLLQFQPADLLELKRKEAEVAAMLQIEEEVLKEHDELSDRSTKLVAQQSTAVARVAVIARTFYELRERIDEDVLELVLEWKREKMREK